MEKLPIGLIGAGPMGASLARACMKIERVEVRAVADVNEETAAALGQELGVDHYGDDGRRIIRRADIAAVIIATPPLLHRKGVQRAAKAGKHIFCEKPMATNVADCDAMIAAVERAGVKFQMGQVLRYLPLQSTALELARSGRYGEPIAVSITRMGGKYGGTWKKRWRDSHVESGGILMEINSHELDLMCQFLGNARSVYALAHRYINENMSTPDQIFVLVDFESGAMGQLHSSAASAIGESNCRVQCRLGTIFYRSGPGLPSTLWHCAFGGETTALPADQIQVEDGVVREVREWVEAVLDDTPVTIPGSDSRKATELAEAAYKSAATGKPVRLPLQRATGVMSREWQEPTR